MKCSHTAAHAAVIEGAAGQDCGPVSSSLQMQHMDHMRPPDSPAAHALPTDRALEHVGRRRRRGGGACALQAPALWPPFLLGAPACALSRYLCLYALREVIGASGSPLHRCRCLHPGCAAAAPAAALPPCSLRKGTALQPRQACSAIPTTAPLNVLSAYCGGSHQRQLGAARTAANLPLKLGLPRWEFKLPIALHSRPSARVVGGLYLLQPARTESRWPAA